MGEENHCVRLAYTFLAERSSKKDSGSPPIRHAEAALGDYIVDEPILAHCASWDHILSAKGRGPGGGKLRAVIAAQPTCGSHPAVAQTTLGNLPRRKGRRYLSHYEWLVIILMAAQVLVSATKN